ncbi:Serine-threonine/tyrosine-protein kinase, catalytic domain [Dillenia turbinata]|uniref:Receptor-like serine/threonine-protein kinase n=1 Tax=Dillenia turbinata TaxID=194707 RepID=A0AAN8UBA3_9MAGN
METWGFFQFIRTIFFCHILVSAIGFASPPHAGQIYPGFEASQKDLIDNDGIFLVSNASNFALRFYTSLNVSLFLLVVIHLDSSRAIWTANRNLLVRNSDKFVFEKNGNAYLQGEGGEAWSTNTSGVGVVAMELQNTGNLVLLGENGSILWQSFSHPTDTLIQGQEFVQGMKLKSFPQSDYLFHYLELKSSDLILYAGYRTPQTYWSLADDSRKKNIRAGGKISSASLVLNSWNFYDQDHSLVWQFNFSENSDPNATWTAVLDSSGIISFYNLQLGKSVDPEQTKIPQKPCSNPEPCQPYYVCSFDNRCQCPTTLNSFPYCRPPNFSSCNSSKDLADLQYVGERFDYFALGFVEPSLMSDLDGCKDACYANCSCLVMFYENTSRRCFLFDQIGSFQRADQHSPGFVSYVKVPTPGDGRSPTTGKGENGLRHAVLAATIVVITIAIIFGLIYLGFWYHRKKQKVVESFRDSPDEDNFFDSFSGMPVRFSYSELQAATNNFSSKLGQGGFGSVYQGVLRDGTQVAVKKLEGIGQGKKEFRAEVSIIGSIHHVHLVKLKGFCAEGTYRLLVYEFLAKGSLDKWIFKKNDEEWITNYAISEKSDVYSFGLVLLEIIGGRKNYDASEMSEKSHFPSYAFKMLEEGRLREILDSRINIEESDERIFNAIKVALWCIQDDMYLRPSMTKVVQMLEGLCEVALPPSNYRISSQLYSSFIKSSSDEGNSSGLLIDSKWIDCKSQVFLSDVRLSGPR